MHCNSKKDIYTRQIFEVTKLYNGQFDTLTHVVGTLCKGKFTCYQLIIIKCKFGVAKGVNSKVVQVTLNFLDPMISTSLFRWKLFIFNTYYLPEIITIIAYILCPSSFFVTLHILKLLVTFPMLNSYHNFFERFETTSFLMPNMTISYNP